MALVALEIPKVGLVMESARLVRWLKNVGEVVKQGEPLVELETEKSLVEIEATESGRLVEILLQVDQEARVGDRIAWLENDAVAAAPALPGATASLPAPGAASPAPARRDEVPLTPAANQERRHGRIRSSPVARRLAAQHAIDFTRIAGTGPRGRVQLSDVRRAIESRAAPGAATAAAISVACSRGVRHAPCAGALHDPE